MKEGINNERERVFVLQRIMWLTFGAFLQGLAMAAFLFPHHIPSGGVAGIAILNGYFFDVSLGLTLWSINFGLLLLAIKKLGKQTAFWTIYSVAITSIVVDWLTPQITNPLNGTLVDVVYGGIIFGTGVGILFRFGASSGGMDIVALILSYWTGKKPGTILFCINSVVLLGTSLMLGIDIIVFALMCQWISTRLIDFVRTVSPKRTAKPYM